MSGLLRGRNCIIGKISIMIVEYVLGLGEIGCCSLWIKYGLSKLKARLGFICFFVFLLELLILFIRIRI